MAPPQLPKAAAWLARALSRPPVLPSALRALLPPRREVFAFLGLGSNVGDRLEHLQAGVDHLHAERRLRVDAVSGVYETAPVGGPPQDPYLNIAVRVATTVGPLGLLRACQRAERRSGRVREVRWGPRTLDVDVLLYDHRTLSSTRLTVPHPRLAERPFALIPLIEVAPGARLPDGRSLVSVLAGLAPIEGVAMIGRQIHEPTARLEIDPIDDEIGRASRREHEVQRDGWRRRRDAEGGAS